MKLLLEMFPAACSVEVSHCLSLSDGNVEKAAQLILHRQETGHTINSSLPKSVSTSVVQGTNRDFSPVLHVAVYLSGCLNGLEFIVFQAHKASNKKKTKPIVDDKKLKQNLLER